MNGPLREMHEMQDLVNRFSIKEKTIGLIRGDQIAKDRVLLGGVRDIIDGAYGGVLVRHAREQHAPKNLYAKLGVDQSAFNLASGLGSVSLLNSQHEQYLRSVTQRDEMLERLKQQALGGLSIWDLTRQLERADFSASAINAAFKSMDSIFSTLKTDALSFYQELNDVDIKKAAGDVESISRSTSDQAYFQAVAEQIASAVSAQPNLLVRFFLWLHFDTLLREARAGFIGAVISLAVAPVSCPTNPSKSPQEVAKNVRQAANVVVGIPDMLADQRYISLDVVHVHKNPRAGSSKLGRLKFGNVVQVIKKEKDFAVVSWFDSESDASIQGWVFSRYLAKFN